MMELHRFPGGIHPDEQKAQSAARPIHAAFVPKKLVVPLRQHIGQPAKPVVQVGEHVLKGQMIAEADGYVSVAIHAPSSGTVTDIGLAAVPHPSGLPDLCITIATDGKDEWMARTPVDWRNTDPAALRGHVRDMGIVGLGGAVFPSSIKLDPAGNPPIHTLVLNGGECEPWITCDDRLMRECAEDILEGARIMQHLLGASRVIAGIEDNKPEAIAAMSRAAEAYGEIKVKPVPARYPMGSEKQLILTLTGREVPATGRPSDVGVLVHNVGTLVAVREAIRFGRPLVSRLITLNGGAMRAPGNIEVPIGALVEEVVAFANGFKEAPARLLMGGPMMGMQLPDLRVPVVKGTSGILALGAAEVAEREPAPCIRCGSCVRACPVGLLPLEMAHRIASADFSGAVGLGLKDCIACGCCAYVCPARIPLVQYFNHARGELAARERAKLRAEAARKLAAARAERIEREAREKAEAAARRKAERDAARKAAAPATTTEEATA